jgi:hypothetical protein
MPAALAAACAMCYASCGAPPALLFIIETERRMHPWRGAMHQVLHWLHKLGDVQILALVFITMTLAMMAAPRLGQIVLRLPERKERDEAVVSAFSAVVSMLGVVLAFSLVQANNTLREFQGKVTKEAVALEVLDRALLMTGKPGFADLRPRLAAYGQSMVTDEWPRLSGGERSAATDDLFNALVKGVRDLGPDDARQQTMYAVLVRTLDELADLREERLAGADPDTSGLPLFFWSTILGLIAVAFCLATFTVPSLGRTVAVGASAAAIAMLLAFVIIVDVPFEGETSVSPRPLQKALLINAKRQ